MKNILFRVLQICLLLTQQAAFAQIKEEYFADNEPAASEMQTAVRNGNFVYTCGSAVEFVGNYPVVRKLDLDGNQIWSNSNLGFTADEYVPVYILLSGADLFVVAQGVWGAQGYQLSRLDESSGNLYQTRHFDTDGIFRMTDYNASELLAYYPTNGNLHQFVRLSKETLDPLSVTPVIGGLPSGGFASSSALGVYFAKGDTIYRHHYTNLSQRLWFSEVSFPANDPVTRYGRLVVNQAENAVYAFGVSQFSERICVAKINATTGAVLWTFRSDLAAEYAPGAIQFVGNELYISWQHLYVGGGVHQIGVSKINTQTGVKIWESANEQVPNNYTEQSGVAMTVHNGLVYLTGYYSADNYGPGKWGVMALNAEDGAVVFRKQVPPTNVGVEGEKLSEGKAVFAKGDRIIVLGNAEKKDFATWATWVEMDGQNGNILFRKIHGGASLYPAEVKELVQLPSGKIVSLIQQGRSGIVRQTDANGTVIWERAFTADFGLKVLQLAQVRGDSIVVAGFSYPDDTGFNSNGHEAKTLRLYLLNGAGILLKALNRSWPASYSMVNQLVRDKQSENYYLAFQDGGQYRVAKFNFSGWVSESAPLEGSNFFLGERQNLCISKTTNELYYFSRGVYSFDLANWPNFTYHLNAFMYRFESILQKDSVIIAVGTGAQPARPVLWKYKGTQTQQVFTIDDMPSLQGFGDIVQGETPSIVYLLADGNFSMSQVYKFNLDTWTVVWSSPVFGVDEAWGVRNRELVYNAASNTVAVVGGFVPPNASGWKGFLKTYAGSTGELIMERYQDTFEEVDDEYTHALADRNSPVLIAGGFLWLNSPIPTQGFLQYYDLAVDHKIHALLYWDVNSNGSYQPSEDFRLNQGRLWLDDGDYLYFNEFGEIAATVLPGPHYLEFEMLPGWELSSASTATTISTLPIPSDTFFIGLTHPGPLPKAEVTATMTGQHFICGDTAELSFKLISSSFSHTNVHIFLKHPGGFINADIPEEYTGADTLFWDGPGMLPFGNWPNTLKFKMPDTAAEGDSLDFELYGLVYDGAGFEPVDTLHVFYREAVKCAFDPNDKIVMPAGQGNTGRTLLETPLTYTIRFQNTGNYLARNIVVRDTLDEHLDPATFVFASASHPITDIKLTDNILEFTFRDINLPDSGSDYFGSQGFVAFSIKPLPDLDSGTPVYNQAAIYFDLNLPVLTNTTLNTYVSSLISTTTTVVSTQPLLIWPNPNNGSFAVELPEPADSDTELRILGTMGQTMRQIPVKQGDIQAGVEVGTLPAGVYFLQVYSSGKMMAAHKFVKTDGE